MAKFYQIGRVDEAEKQVHLETYVYGPFQDEAELLKNAPRRRQEKQWKLIIFDAEIIEMPKDPKEKPESEKRAPGNEKNWKKVDGSWKCKECGADILAAKVAHAIHDGPFEGSGSGECSYEDVGYCPNCEKKPNFHGTPIRVPWR